jgi:hypothetical protein
MDAYQYALMKKTLERIQKRATIWRNVTEAMENYSEGDDIVYEDPEALADEMMYEIETILDEAGFHE